MARTRMVVVALLTMLVPLLVTTPAQGASTGRAAAVAPPATSPTEAIGGERVTFTGSVPAAAPRVVRLQQRVGSRWRTVATGRSDAAGAYSLAAAAKGASGTTLRFRVVAPRSGPARAVTSAVRTVAVVEQTAGLSRSADRASVPVTVTWTATFSPVRPGRAVVFEERRADGTWAVLQRGVQDDSGTAVHTATYVLPGAHPVRATTSAAAGAAAISTPTLTYQAQLAP